MVDRRVWFERAFPRSVPPDASPEIIECLRGTPARLEERVRPIPTDARTARHGSSWSIQEHVGHLLDLEELWIARVRDLERGAKVLTEADLTNTRTHQANHNATDLEALLGSFRETRLPWVAEIANYGADALQRTALHPRLEQPMTVVDLAFFVAEHDDHHLASITDALTAA